MSEPLIELALERYGPQRLFSLLSFHSAAGTDSFLDEVAGRWERAAREMEEALQRQRDETAWSERLSAVQRASRRGARVAAPKADETSSGAAENALDPLALESREGLASQIDSRDAGQGGLAIGARASTDDSAIASRFGASQQSPPVTFETGSTPRLRDNLDRSHRLDHLATFGGTREESESESRRDSPLTVDPIHEFGLPRNAPCGVKGLPMSTLFDDAEEDTRRAWASWYEARKREDEALEEWKQTSF